MKSKIQTGICLGFLAVGSASAQTGGDWYRVAEQAATEGRLEDMQAAYEQVLLRTPNDARALTGKATALAWQNEFDDAIATYAVALGKDPNNVEAIVGQGYAYAWSGRYSRAHTQFGRALRVDPENISARKGIGYSYYWSGDHELALAAFEIAASVQPKDAEIAEASGRVNTALGHTKTALSQFDLALQLDPSRSSARLAKRSAATSAPMIEATARYGATSNAGTGLRGVEVAHWPDATTRFSLRFDNSLSLDSSILSESGEDVRGYFAAARQAIADRWWIGAELGRRRHVSGNEDVVGFQGGYRSSIGDFRLGLSAGKHAAGHTDKQFFAGLNFPVGTRWRIDPTLYLTEAGTLRDNEWRGVLNVEYLTDSVWQFGGFVGLGNIDAADPSFDGDTKVAGVWSGLLLADRHTLSLAARTEDSPTSSFTIIEIGFTYRQPGN